MSEDGKDNRPTGGENFLARWSRLKRDVREKSAGDERPLDDQSPAPPVAASNSPPPQLPPLDTLTMDSDYRDFFHPKVDEKLRQAALKKLFSDPHFNVMDGLDVYIDDYSKPNPLPAAMLSQLKQAQNILEWAKEMKEETEAKRAGVVPSLTDQAELPAGAAEPPVLGQLQEAEQHPESPIPVKRKL